MDEESVKCHDCGKEMNPYDEWVHPIDYMQNTVFLCDGCAVHRAKEPPYATEMV